MCVKHWGPHSAYTFLAPTVGLEKIIFFGLLLHFFILFLVRCPYSPYDLVRISREIIYFRATPQNLRAKILCGPREKIPLRANRRQNLLSSRGPCMISRETLWTSRDLESIFARDCLISRDLENVFARDCITSRGLKFFFAQTVRFRAKSCDSKLYFLDSILRIFRFFAANCSWFHIFVFSDFFLE